MRRDDQLCAQAWLDTNRAGSAERRLLARWPRPAPVTERDPTSGRACIPAAGAVSAASSSMVLPRPGSPHRTSASPSVAAGSGKHRIGSSSRPRAAGACEAWLNTVSSRARGISSCGYSCAVRRPVPHEIHDFGLAGPLFSCARGSRMVAGMSGYSVGRNPSITRSSSRSAWALPSGPGPVRHKKPIRSSTSAGSSPCRMAPAASHAASSWPTAAVTGA